MERFCRTCLHSIPRDSMFFQLDGEDRSIIAPLIMSQLQACIPEVRVGIIKNPILCNPCLNDLTSAYKFKSKCLETEKLLLEYVLHADASTTYVDINLLVKSVPTEYTFENKEIYKEKYVSPRKYNQKLKSKSISPRNIFLSSYNSTSKDLDHTYSSSSLPSSYSQVGDPFTGIISKEALNTSIANGLKIEGAQLSSFTIDTMLGDCIDINDSDEEMSATILPNSKHIINSELAEKQTCDDDVDVVGNLETVNPPNLNLHEILDNISPTSNNEENSNNKRKYFTGSSNTKKKVVIEKSTNSPLKTSDNKKNDLPLPSISNKTTSDIEILPSKDTVDSDSDKSVQSTKVPEVTEELPLYSSFEDNLNMQVETIIQEVSVESSSEIELNMPVDTVTQEVSVNSPENDLNVEVDNVTQEVSLNSSFENNANMQVDTVTQRVSIGSSLENSSNMQVDTVTKGVSFRVSIGKELNKQVDTVTTDISLGDLSILSDEIIPPTNCDVEIKSENEGSSLDVSTDIQIKDELIIKDECEYESHKSMCETFQSNSYSSDEEEESIRIREPIDHEIEVESTDGSSSEASSDNVISTPYYREARKGCYSCAVCNYSCNSETVLVDHTKMHVNKRRKSDNFVFRGFSRKHLVTGCKNCNYARTNKLLRVLQTKILLPNSNYRLQH